MTISTAVIFFILGVTLSIIGFGLNTWQFWVIIITAATANTIFLNTYD